MAAVIALALGLVAGWLFEFGVRPEMQGPIAKALDNTDISWLGAALVGGGSTTCSAACVCVSDHRSDGHLGPCPEPHPRAARSGGPLRLRVAASRMPGVAPSGPVQKICAIGVGRRRKEHA